MYYVTVKQSPMYHQMSLEELLFSDIETPSLLNSNSSNTKTYEVNQISDKFLSKFNINALIKELHDFNLKYEYLRNVKRETLYRRFPIPKRSGGVRIISAPNDELSEALRRLKSIFEDDFGALYHTSAFAYIKKRSTLSAIKRHQSNESKWFAKYDLSDFFSNTTLEFVMTSLSSIFPFCEVIKRDNGKTELREALDLAFLDGGLPQGTPISPLITNIIMIPIDFKLNNTLRNFNNQRYIYTRYADDFTISSRYDFNFKDVENLISNTLSEFNAPFKINRKKTRYGSSSGSNWNLGLMLNKDNKITVGHKRKKELQTMMACYIMDSKNGIIWNKQDIMAMDGLRSYIYMVEGDVVDKIIEHINNKFNVNVVNMIKRDLKK